MLIERMSSSVAPGEWAILDFTRRLQRRLVKLGGGKVCELGGGAFPALSREFLVEHGLECLVVDLSTAELGKASPEYATLIGDVSSPHFATGEHEGSYDVVFSRVVAEHVADGSQFHHNAHRLLKPGGIAMHFFPTLWWPPFIANKLLPETVSEWILKRVQPWRTESGSRGKFPAHYHWCFGPTEKQLSRLRSVGFDVEHCVAYFGEQSHAKFPLLKRIDKAWTDIMLRRPNYHLTSYAAYTLRAR
jgi:SAM-dependent methyltransferase